MNHSRSDGYLTKRREQILRFLAANEDREVGVNEINDFLATQSLQANVSTIYRYLNRLVVRGAVIKTVHGRNGQATFQYIEGKRGCCSHLHLKCRKCGRILHLDCVYMQDVLKHIKSDHGFVVDCPNSFLTGLCRGCAEEEQAWLDISLEECNDCEDKTETE